MRPSVRCAASRSDANPGCSHIVHRLGDIAVARELAIFRAQPGLELRYQRRDERAAHRESLVNGTAVDLSLDVEDRIDALYRFEGKRRDDRELAARFGCHVGELEELAATVRPAARLGDWPRLSVGLVEPIEAGIGIGLQNPGIVAQMALRMLGSAIARIEEHRGWRSGTCEGLVVAHIRP